ncbi:hypothetical protein Hanom_Chr05g00470651 [Helianthus anomalus]
MFHRNHSSTIITHLLYLLISFILFHNSTIITTMVSSLSSTFSTPFLYRFSLPPPTITHFSLPSFDDW